MGEERPHISTSTHQRPPTAAEGVPAEEGMTQSDVEERVDLDPEEQPNRTDQADMSPEERRQYDDPPLAQPIAEADRPEDR